MDAGLISALKTGMVEILTPIPDRKAFSTYV